jgi:hypothetical protein
MPKVSVINDEELEFVSESLMALEELLFLLGINQDDMPMRYHKYSIRNWHLTELEESVRGSSNSGSSVS